VPVDYLGQPGAIYRVDHVGQGYGPPGFVGLQMADQVQSSHSGRIRQGIEFFLHIPDPVLTKISQPGLVSLDYGFPANCFTDTYQRNLAGISPGPVSRLVNPRPHFG
jgi:hypothetical protein